MQEEEKLVKLNCLLQGEVAAKFAKIKEAKGLTNKTEVIRLLISEFYATLGKEA